MWEQSSKGRRAFVWTVVLSSPLWLVGFVVGVAWELWTIGMRGGREWVRVEGEEAKARVKTAENVRRAAVAFAVLVAMTGCAVSVTGWTRADLPVEAQQQRLTIDREECEAVTRQREALAVALFGAQEIVTCLERKGWVSVQ